MDTTNPTETTRGRPTKYKPEYCELVVELGKKGMSKIEMACECDVADINVLDDWSDKFVEFSIALKKAMTFSQAWWERQGRNGVYDKDGERLNASYTKQMAARFPKTWREQTAVQLDAKVQTTVVEAQFADRPDEP